MKKVLIGISIFIIVIILIALSIIIGNKASSYEFHDNLTEKELLYINVNDKDVYICDNCLYSGESGDFVLGTMFDVDSSSGELELIKKEEYEYVIGNLTGAGIKLRDNYRKAIAYYGIKDGYANWNMENKDGSIYQTEYPSKYMDDKDLKNGFLNFVYIKDNDKWELLKASKFAKSGSMILNDYDEYVYFSFQFVFNGSSEFTKNDRMENMTIYHYKK